MLDTTGLIVDAVYMTVPASVWRYLQEHRNPRTVDGEYKTIRRYTQEKDRKRALANICRQYWFRARGKGRTNRFTWEPYHQYLTMPLVGQLVQCLVNKFRYRSSKQFALPFPQFEILDEDYGVWEMQALRGAAEMLQMEKEMSGAA